MGTAQRKKRRSPWVWVALFAAFMGLVVYRSFHVAGYRCAVCMTFQGQRACRTVDGPSEHEARMAATNNACAFLASGVTDSMACERGQPSSVECSAIN